MSLCPVPAQPVDSWMVGLWSSSLRESTLPAAVFIRQIELLTALREYGGGGGGGREGGREEGD